MKPRVLPRGARSVLACALLLVAGSGVAAEFPSMPQPSSSIDAPSLDVRKHLLDNGLMVWIVPRPGLPLLHALVAVRGGLAFDDAHHAGTAELLGEVPGKGAAGRDAGAIAEGFQAVGGELLTRATQDGLYFGSSAMASSQDDLLSQLADVVMRPDFPPAAVEQSKVSLLAELQSAQGNPRFVAERRLDAAIFGTHPYVRFADAAGVAAVNAEYLRAEYRRRFRPDAAVVVVVGDVSDAGTLALVEKHFGGWRAMAGAPPPPPPAVPSRGREIAFIARPGSKQSTFRLGRSALQPGHADEPALSLAAAIMGNGLNSRLNRNLRQEHGYTYGAGVQLRPLRAGDTIVATTEVRNEVTGAALAEMENEFRRIGREPVPATELDSAKRLLSGQYLLRMQLRADVAQSLAVVWMNGQPAEAFAEYPQRVAEVDAAKLMAVSRYLSPDAMSLVVVGDPEVEAQLPVASPDAR